MGHRASGISVNHQVKRSIGLLSESQFSRSPLFKGGTRTTQSPRTIRGDARGIETRLQTRDTESFSIKLTPMVMKT